MRHRSRCEVILHTASTTVCSASGLRPDVPQSADLARPQSRARSADASGGGPDSTSCRVEMLGARWLVSVRGAGPRLPMSPPPQRQVFRSGQVLLSATIHQHVHRAHHGYDPTEHPCSPWSINSQTTASHPLQPYRNRPKHPPCIRIGSRHPVLMVRGNITNYARRNPSSARILIPSADTHFEGLLTFSWVDYRPGSGGHNPPRVSIAMAINASGL